MRIWKWIIIDKKELEFLKTDAREARSIIFWYNWGEEWLDAEDVIDDVRLKLDAMLKRIDRILYGKKAEKLYYPARLKNKK